MLVPVLVGLQSARQANQRRHARGKLSAGRFGRFTLLPSHFAGFGAPPGAGSRWGGRNKRQKRCVTHSQRGTGVRGLARRLRARQAFSPSACPAHSSIPATCHLVSTAAFKLSSRLALLLVRVGRQRNMSGRGAARGAWCPVEACQAVRFMYPITCCPSRGEGGRGRGTRTASAPTCTQRGARMHAARPPPG